MKKFVLALALLFALPVPRFPREPVPACYEVRFDGEVWLVCDNGQIFRIGVK